MKLKKRGEKIAHSRNRDTICLKNGRWWMKSSGLWGDHVFILFGFEDVCVCVCVCVIGLYVWNEFCL